VRGISQCWQAELRPHGIRVVCVCPSEVQTDFEGKAGRNNPNKLYAVDIAATIMAALDMPRRALWPELAVFANNPWKES
jgi:3-oxoacyl-[acyl-carrier protein] reductase